MFKLVIGLLALIVAMSIVDLTFASPDHTVKVERGKKR